MRESGAAGDRQGGASKARFPGRIGRGWQRRDSNAAKVLRNEKGAPMSQLDLLECVRCRKLALKLEVCLVVGGGQRESEGRGGKAG
jgi:hypothetical protein